MLNNLKNRILVVGAGISGSVIARYLAEKQFSVEVIDKREHIGGNCYDYLDNNNILIHKYGPHLFHTSNSEVINYLSKFTEWVDYRHKVKALLHNGAYVTLPVNQETARIVGHDNIISTFFEPYTKKMWGCSISEINPQILKRVPIRDDLNELYFPDDSFQKMPQKGFTAMFKEMLDHPNITVMLNKQFNKDSEDNYFHIFNSMSIDEYFNYCYGPLPYRSIKFHTYTIPVPQILPCATVNFTHDGPYTRVTEWKKISNSATFHPNRFKTTITVEEPCSYTENGNERYYPIKDANGINYNLYIKYKELIQSNMTFIGRCGTYRYLDMDDAISDALDLVKSFCKDIKN